MRHQLNRIEFCDYHLGALMTREIRHNLMIAQLERYKSDTAFDLQTWSLGRPGECAAMVPGRPIILGELRQLQCNELAELTAGLTCESVVGPDHKPLWFAQHAASLGIRFNDPVPQRIYSIDSSPKYPDAKGVARKAGAQDLEILAEWIPAFVRDATHDVAPTREHIAAIISQDRHMLWIVDDEPVSMAAINRRTPHSAAIGSVYTPPEHRQKGYAGCVTAAVVERVYAEGKSSACLYTDLRNPFSNRCYTKIGFKPECDSMQVTRKID